MMTTKREIKIATILCRPRPRVQKTERTRTEEAAMTPSSCPIRHPTMGSCSDEKGKKTQVILKQKEVHTLSSIRYLKIIVTVHSFPPFLLPPPR
mmetsp:Transcript_5138/g.14954  ORF Transcript_5138/g.14954 Transcript_5138/m.14954 type:complete len:94 (+) Transcript_5138:936-1217(+)